MRAQMWVATLLVVSQISCLALVPPKFEWKVIDFAWESFENRELAINNRFYIPEGNLPTGLARWNDKLFITIPRWKKGVPSSLNYVDLSSSGPSNQPLNPYPSWRDGFLPDTACCAVSNSTVVSAFRPYVDTCNRLWVADNGVSNMMRENAEPVRQIVSPSIMVFDLTTDTLLHKYYVPAEVLKDSSVLSSIVVDTVDPVTKAQDCDNAFAYITDMGANSVIVFNLRSGASWKVESPFFHFDPHASTYLVGGIEFFWHDGVSSAALGPIRADGYRDVFLQPTSSTKLFKVSTHLLRNQTAHRNEYYSGVQIVGDRGPESQVTACDFDPNTNVLFYTQLSKSGVGCWSVAKEFKEENHPVIFNDCQLLEFPNDLKVDQLGNIWILSDRQSRFLYEGIDPEEVNFRVFTAPVSKFIENTSCESPGLLKVLARAVGLVKSPPEYLGPTSLLPPSKDGHNTAPMSGVSSGAVIHSQRLGESGQKQPNQQFNEARPNQHTNETLANQSTNGNSGPKTRLSLSKDGHHATPICDINSCPVINRPQLVKSDQEKTARQFNEQRPNQQITEARASQTVNENSVQNTRLSLSNDGYFTIPVSDVNSSPVIQSQQLVESGQEKTNRHFNEAGPNQQINEARASQAVNGNSGTNTRLSSSKVGYYTIPFSDVSSGPVIQSQQLVASGQAQPDQQFNEASTIQPSNQAGSNQLTNTSLGPNSRLSLSKDYTHTGPVCAVSSCPALRHQQLLERSQDQSNQQSKSLSQTQSKCKIELCKAYNIRNSQNKYQCNLSENQTLCKIRSCPIVKHYSKERVYNNLTSHFYQTQMPALDQHQTVIGTQSLGGRVFKGNRPTPSSSQHKSYSTQTAINQNQQLAGNQYTSTNTAVQQSQPRSFVSKNQSNLPLSNAPSLVVAPGQSPPRLPLVWDKTEQSKSYIKEICGVNKCVTGGNYIPSAPSAPTAQSCCEVGQNQKPLCCQVNHQTSTSCCDLEQGLRPLCCQIAGENPNNLQTCCEVDYANKPVCCKLYNMQGLQQLPSQTISQTTQSGVHGNQPSYTVSAIQNSQTLNQSVGSPIAQSTRVDYSTNQSFGQPIAQSTRVNQSTNPSFGQPIVQSTKVNQSTNKSFGQPLAHSTKIDQTLIQSATAPSTVDQSVDQSFGQPLACSSKIDQSSNSPAALGQSLDASVVPSSSQTRQSLEATNVTKKGLKCLCPKPQPNK